MVIYFGAAGGGWLSSCDAARSLCLNISLGLFSLCFTSDAASFENQNKSKKLPAVTLSG